MKCLRIYATPDGESHFEEAEIPLTLAELFPDRPSFYLSSRYTASRVRFVSIPAGVKEANWHTAPERLLAVWLNGETEFETSDGEIRRLPPGGLLLAEDVHGKGHVSRHPEEGQQLIIISMPDGIQ
jgi:hypothetical protein